MTMWNTETKDERCFIRSCEHSNEAPSYKITIDSETWRVMVALTRTIKLEWQAFLTGTALGNEVYVSGYWIPKQRVSAGHVENLDVIDAQVVQEKHIVASIHSHSDMGVFHSSTDIDSTCKSAWVKHHITINNKLEYVAISQHPLPCGKIAFHKAEVAVPALDASVSIEGLSNIEKPDGRQMSSWSSRGINWSREDDYDDSDGYWKQQQSSFNNETNAKVSPLHNFNRYNKHATHHSGDVEGITYV